MNDAIGGGSYGTFLKRSSRPGWIEEQARIAFRVRPKRCLDLMKVDDAEVSRLTEQAEIARKDHDDHWRAIPKINAPFR